MIVLTLLTASISGCSQETKYKVLTFFFTGVPSPENEKKTDLEKEQTAEAPVEVEQAAPVATVYTHPLTAASLCNECHQTTANFRLFSQVPRPANFQKGGMSPGPLVVDRERLCVKCHKDKSATEVLPAGLWLHPTSAKGECDACHDPHQSTNPYMLLESDEKICTQCHKEDEMLAKVEDKKAHRQPSDCLSCHNPHIGENRLLLTKDYKEVKHPVGPIPGLPDSQPLPKDFEEGGSVSQEKAEQAVQ
jgi:predicted CXXCH cytochrome family protein